MEIILIKTNLYRADSINITYNKLNNLTEYTKK